MASHGQLLFVRTRKISLSGAVWLGLSQGMVQGSVCRSSLQVSALAGEEQGPEPQAGTGGAAQTPERGVQGQAQGRQMGEK